MEWFMSQPWYAMVAEIVMFANSITMMIPDKWAAGIPGFNIVMNVLNWISMNVFNNKNAPE